MTFQYFYLLRFIEILFRFTELLLNFIELLFRFIELINRGDSNFVMNMAFISSCEVKNYIFHEWQSHK